MANSQEFRKKFYLSNISFLVALVLILGTIFLLRDVIGGAKVDLTADKIYTISPETKNILSKLIDTVTVKYYVSEELPEQLRTLKRDTKDMFDEFYDLSNKHFQYAIVNPEDEASAAAEKKVTAYYDAKKAGKTPEEPQPPQTIEMMFSQRPKPSGDEIRKSREELAAKMAAQQQKSKDDVERDLLFEEYKRVALENLEQEGIQSIPVQERDADSVRQLRIFSAIEIKYLSREAEIIPFHTQIENLEYELANRVVKLTTKDKPLVAFFDGRKPEAPPMNPMNPTPPPPSDYEAIINYFNQQQFEVEQVSLKEGNAIDDLIKRRKESDWRKANEDKDEAEKKEMPEEEKAVKDDDVRKHIKCFVVAQPDNLEPRQVYEINRTISLGVPTILLISRYSLDISQRGVQTGLPIASVNPGLEDMLRKWGIELGDELLASNEAGTVMVPRQVMRGIVAQVPTDLPVVVAAPAEAINQSLSLTNRITVLVFPATPGLRLKQETLNQQSLKAEVLAKTSKHAWGTKVNPFERMQNPLFRQQGMGMSVVQYREQLAEPKDPEKFRDFIEPAPLAALVTGKFSFSFEGEAIPDWKKEEKKDKAGGANPHAGIPGFPGLDEEGDNDLRLNLLDPQDAKADAGADAAPAAPAQPAPAVPPVGTPPVVPPPSQPAPAAPAAPPPTPEATTPPAPGTQPAATAPPPAPPPAEKPKATLQPSEGGRLLVLASVDMMKNDFLVLSQQNPEYQANVRFFQNAVENFGSDENLINIRRKQVTVRQFKEGSDKKSIWITLFNTAGVPLLVAVLGIAYFLVRRADSIGYERRYIQRQS